MDFIIAMLALLFVVGVFVAIIIGIMTLIKTKFEVSPRQSKQLRRMVEEQSNFEKYIGKVPDEDGKISVDLLKSAPTEVISVSKNIPEGEKWYLCSDVGKMFGVTAQTVRSWIRNQEIEATLDGRVYKISEESVRNYEKCTGRLRRPS